MQKPKNYENTQAQGEFTPVEFGGHRRQAGRIFHGSFQE